MKKRAATKRVPAGRGLRDLPGDMAELVRLCFDATPDSMAVFLPDGRFAYVNQAACRNLGYRAEEIMGKTTHDLDPKMEAVNWRRHWQAIKRSGARTFESTHRRKDGTIFPVEITSSFIRYRGRDYIFSHAKDINRRKQAEQALRESQERYRKIFQGSAQGILVAEISTMRFKFANPAICALLGYTERELVGKTVSDIHPRESLADIKNIFMAQAEGKQIFAHAIPCLCKDGSLRYADISTTSMEFDGVPCNVGFFTDVTAQKTEIEQRLQTEVLLRLAFERAPVATALIDVRTGGVQVNEQCARLLGRQLSELRQRGIDAFLDPDDADNNTAALTAMPQRLRDAVVSEVRYAKPDGRTLHIRRTAQGIFNQRGNLISVIVLLEDITRRKQHSYLNASIQKKLRDLYADLQYFFESFPGDNAEARPASLADFGLSATEAKVAGLLYRGHPNIKIAQTLHVSANTVKHHITGIFRKCAVQNRVEFLRLMRDLHIVL